MRGIINRDLFLLIKIFKVYGLPILLSIILFIFLARSEVGARELLYVISGSTSTYHSFFTFSIGLIINSIFILISLYILNFDLELCYKDIFLGISKKQWLYGKCISLFIINLFICLLIVVLYYLYSIFILNSIYLYTVEFIPILLLSKYIIQLMFLMFNILNIKGKIVIPYIILMFPVLSNTKLLEFIYVTDYKDGMDFIIGIIICMLIIITINKYLTNIFERRI